MKVSQLFLPLNPEYMIIPSRQAPRESLLPPNTHFDFELPEALECSLPTEQRGIARDEIRMMVSHMATDEVEHRIFRNLPDYLEAGDVLVVNTSGTLKAALETRLEDGREARIHLSTPLESGHWIAEIREVYQGHSRRFIQDFSDRTLPIPNGAQLELLLPQNPDRTETGRLQLWEVRLVLGMAVSDYLARFGCPIKYKNLDQSYPQSWYQTVFATDWGSAEMPSAGRGFTPGVVHELGKKGVEIVPILLHTGVSSLEVDEQPYAERYHISANSANSLNRARSSGKRIIAVGTTAVRAVETLTTPDGITRGGSGKTSLYITPDRGLYGIDGLLTGFHEPRASHLWMLEALAGKPHLGITYSAALEAKYFWHEFGDVHLILP